MKIDKEVEEAIIAYRSTILARSYLTRLNVQIGIEKRKQQEIAHALSISETELFDLENKRDLRRISNIIFGKRNKEILEIERQWYYDLFLKYNNSKRNIKMLEFEVEVLSAKLGKEEVLKEKLEQLIIQRKDELSNSGIANLDQVLEVLELIDNSIGLKTELKEALTAGEELLDALKKASDYLLQFSYLNKDNTGDDRYDSLIGLGFVKLKKIQELSINCESQLLKYEEEIADIYEYLCIKQLPKLNDSKDFVDNYFDALTTDHILNQSWETAFSYLKNIGHKITRTQKTLLADLTQVKKEIEDYNQRKDELMKEVKL